MQCSFKIIKHINAMVRNIALLFSKGERDILNSGFLPYRHIKENKLMPMTAQLYANTSLGFIQTTSKHNTQKAF